MVDQETETSAKSKRYYSLFLLTWFTVLRNLSAPDSTAIAGTVKPFDNRKSEFDPSTPLKCATAVAQGRTLSGAEWVRPFDSPEMWHCSRSGSNPESASGGSNGFEPSTPLKCATAVAQGRTLSPPLADRMGSTLLISGLPPARHLLGP